MGWLFRPSLFQVSAKVRRTIILSSFPVFCHESLGLYALCDGCKIGDIRAWSWLLPDMVGSPLECIYFIFPWRTEGDRRLDAGRHYMSKAK